MKPDIYIAIPSCRDWKAEFGISMIGLAVHLTKKMKEGKIRGFYCQNKISSHLPKGRQLMLNEALDGKYTHILMIDDDQAFTPECIDLMLSRNKPFVSANICKKSFTEGGWIAGKGDGSKIDSTDKTGIEQAHTVGLGLVLLELEPLRKLKPPHFEMLWIGEERGMYMGEDIYFCMKLKHEAGISPWVDHDVSNIVTHVGNHGYGAQDFKQEEAA